MMRPRRMARNVNSVICMVGGTKGWNFFGGAWSTAISRFLKSRIRPRPVSISRSFTDALAASSVQYERFSTCTCIARAAPTPRRNCCKIACPSCPRAKVSTSSKS